MHAMEALRKVRDTAESINANISVLAESANKSIAPARARIRFTFFIRKSFQIDQLESLYKIDSKKANRSLKI